MIDLNDRAERREFNKMNGIKAKYVIAFINKHTRQDISICGWCQSWLYDNKKPMMDMTQEEWDVAEQEITNASHGMCVDCLHDMKHTR